jgi:D-alanyl-D-alanine carboxypeptidase
VFAGSVAVAVGLGVVLSPPTSVNAFGTLGRAEAASPQQPAAGAAKMAFPGVPGVDLLAIGYRGVDLDAVTVADLDRPLPELPTERATELRSRIEVATAHVEGLRGAEYVLYETARAMKADVREAGRARDAAVVTQDRAGARLVEVRARVAQAAEGRAARPLPPEPLPVDVDALLSAATVRAAELDALAALEAHAAAEADVAAVEARRQAHRAALDLTHRAANRMDAHIGYLYNELHAARAGMLPAGRWLAEAERGRQDLPLVKVRGFKVHGAIAGSLEDLLEAAEADGIELRGEAHRSTKRQIELRRAHCGPTDQDIWEKPSGACSPPTAKPHRSLHESGLAVDFVHGEQSITSRRSPAYRWLAANAASYGFFNLASEPWHWSVSAT